MFLLRRILLSECDLLILLQGAKLTGGDRVLLKEDTGATGGDVEAGAVRDNEEEEVLKRTFLTE